MMRDAGVDRWVRGEPHASDHAPTWVVLDLDGRAANAKKTAVKKTAMKKTAMKKTAMKKTAVKKTAVKKTAVKKTADRPSAAGTTRARASKQTGK
jgi:exodeoxyribonuclease-3